MNNKTTIKDKRLKKNIILTIVFSVISLGLGFLIAYFGKEKSYIEADMITPIFTLFGFGLTAAVFVYQAFEKNQNKETKNVIKAISKTLFLTLCLIVTTILLDFLSSLDLSNKVSLLINTMKYASLIYSIICQFDILNAFTIIMKN